MNSPFVDNLFGFLFGRDSADGQPWPSAKSPDAPPWVLHIEDDVDFSTAMKHRLESLGVAVVRAFDGMDGCHCAFTYPANAILLDMQMPNGTGEDVLRCLKANPNTADIPVIILSSLKNVAIQRRLLALGATQYLTKDASVGELTAALSKHIHLLGDRKFHVAPLECS